MKKSEIKKLDKAWSETIKKINGFCIMCGSPKVQACHIISRRFRATRWETANGVSMCYVHHREFDQHMPNHEQIIDRMGRDRYNMLFQWANDPSKIVETKRQVYEEVLEKIYNGLRD